MKGNIFVFIQLLSDVNLRNWLNIYQDIIRRLTWRATSSSTSATSMGSTMTPVTFFLPATIFCWWIASLWTLTRICKNIWFIKMSNFSLHNYLFHCKVIYRSNYTVPWEKASPKIIQNVARNDCTCIFKKNFQPINSQWSRLKGLKDDMMESTIRSKLALRLFRCHIYTYP